jgi:hypothetical protein
LWKALKSVIWSGGRKCRWSEKEDGTVSAERCGKEEERETRRRGKWRNLYVL